MNVPQSNSTSDARERFEQQADAVRERLISNIDELSQRTQRFEALFGRLLDQAKRHKVPLIAAGVGFTALSIIALLKHRATVKRRERTRLLSHVAMQLIGVTPPPPEEPGLIRKSLATLGTMVATAAVQEVQQRVLHGIAGAAASDSAEP